MNNVHLRVIVLLFSALSNASVGQDLHSHTESHTKDCSPTRYSDQDFEEALYEAEVWANTYNPHTPGVRTALEYSIRELHINTDFYPHSPSQPSRRYYNDIATHPGSN